MWYYAEHGVRIGPLDSAQLAVQVAEGALSSKTLVWREGMESWRPFSDVQELRKAHKQMQDGTDAARFPSQPLEMQDEPEVTPFVVSDSGPENVCCECEQSRSADLTVKLGGRWVCAHCKPTYLQKLEEKVYERRILNYAGFSSRLHVAMTEFNVIAILPVFFMNAYYTLSSTYGYVISIIVLLVIRMLYEVVAVGMNGNTFIQNRWGLKVVNYDGSPLTFLKSLLRTLANLLTYGTFGFGFGLVLADVQKRSLTDWICGTRVIYLRK